MKQRIIEGMVTYPGRVGIQQRVLPSYRVPFFDTLASACEGGLCVFAGESLPEEQVAAGRLSAARHFPAHNVNILPFASPWYLCYQYNWRAWLEEWQPDALILEANPRYPANRWMLRWMHARGRPVLGWGLGAPPASRRNLLSRLADWWGVWQRKRLAGTVDGLIAYSQRGAEQYRQLGMDPGRIFIAPNAVAPRPKSPPAGDREDGGRQKILFVGRLQRRKRIDNLLQACAALPTAIQPEVWVVGDGPARSEYQSLASAIYPQASFLGALHGEQLEPYFRRANLFVLPGTGGLAIQQAMAHGLPVISAQADGTQEDLVRPGNGWQVPPDDLIALQAALQTALEDPQRLRRMGFESYRIVSEEINLEAMAAAFLRALCQLDKQGSMPMMERGI